MKLGSTIRRIRKEKKLTIKDISIITNMTESLISQIENNKATPSVPTLMAISKSLDIPIGSLFEDERETASPVLRSIDRPIVNTTSGITYFLLGAPQDNFPVEVIFGNMEKGASQELKYNHVGVECGTVITGKLKVEYNDSTHILYPGDSITIESNIPHMIENMNNGETTFIWVNSPPTF